MNAPLPKPIQRSIDAAASAQNAIALAQQNAVGVMDNPAQFLAATSAQTEAGATPVASAPAPATPPMTPTPAVKSEDWEQKFRSLQGRMRSESADAQAANKQLLSQMAQMQQQITVLASAKATEAKPAADPRDVENFGPDMLEMVHRYADRLVQNAYTQLNESVKAVADRVTNLETSVTGVTQRTEVTLEQQFYAALAGAVPDWQQINLDERWLEWLAAQDPVYGAPRQAALDMARERLDAQRVVNIFNEFKRMLPAVPPRPSLADQVAPTTVSAQTPVAAPAAMFLSQKFVERFYNDKAKGRIVGAEAERIEAEINRAAAEGRIR